MSTAAQPLRPTAPNWAAGKALGGLFLAGFLAYGIGVYGFTQFLNPIRLELGWNRAMTGGLMSAFWLAAPFVLLASYLLDRVGLRALVLAGACIEAIGLVWMTRLSSPNEFLAIRFIMGAGKCLVVTPLPIACARWFLKRPGMAVAIALCGWHAGGLVMAPLAAQVIGTQGWRFAAQLLAAILVAGMAFAAWLMRPPCAGAAGGSDVPAAAAPAQFASMASLMVLGLATVAFYAGYAALLSQLTPMLADTGLDAGTIDRATGALSLFAMGGVLVGGALTQVMNPRAAGALLLILMVLAAMGTFLFVHGAHPALILSMVLLQGLLIGAGDPILIEALRRSVPAARFAPAYGWWYLLCLASLAAVPVVSGAVFDRSASYGLAFGVIASGCAIAAAAWVAVMRPVARDG